MLTYEEIRKASTKKLKSILRNDDPDLETFDMIEKNFTLGNFHEN